MTAPPPAPPSRSRSRARGHAVLLAGGIGVAGAWGPWRGESVSPRPVVLGAGSPTFPPAGERYGLEFRRLQVLSSGVVVLVYGPVRG